MATLPQLPADGDESRSDGQTPRNQLGAQGQHSVGHGSRQPRTVTDGSELQRPGGHSLHLDFQDSNSSPALSLVPANSGVEHNFTEYSLFYQRDNEFVPLRAYPDVSMASETFRFPRQDQSTSEHQSLSQHRLAETSVLSEEGASCSVSQDSLSPKDGGRHEKISPSDLITADNGDKGSETAGSLVGEAPEDELFLMRRDVSAKQLLGCLQKDVAMPSGSSTVSSDSGNSVKSITHVEEGPEKIDFCKPSTNRSMIERERPPGEASLPQQPNRPADSDQSQTLSSEVGNITMGSRSTQPDDATELLHRELLSEIRRLCACEAESNSLQQKGPSLPSQALTPDPTEMPGVTSGVRTTTRPLPWTGPFSAGITRIQREHDLWSSGNQTGIDGSYLGFLPQSQSTPGVFKEPAKSTAKAKLGQLSVVQSSNDNSRQTNTGVSPQAAVPAPEEATTAKVQALPSLNYMQKVDAWRANQSSGQTSLFDSLALQGFSGISPKKKAYDAVSDTLNHILTQHVKNLQPPVSSAANQTVTQSSAPPGSSSPTRGEAVGSAPSDKDNAKSGAGRASSPLARSQSHSSLSTVVTLAQRDQQTDRAAEKELVEEQQPGGAGRPPGRFSDVCVDKTVASSQDSHSSGVKLGTSVGASSATSLEVDNYAPYWTSKPTPPPVARSPELNIEERIPMYLHNLGIDQSPSAILTPFVPRGPIREPEFSPTDLSTIKGSVGTPSKSTQPSEGGSPHKGEFSRCGVPSVDSSVSIPLSLDSPSAAVLPEQIQRTCSSPGSEAQSQRRLASSPQPDDAAQPSPQQHEDERKAASPAPPNCDLDRSADSFVSSKALWEIRKLLCEAENVVSAASSASAALPRLLSDGDVFLSMTKTSTGLQTSSSSAAADDASNRSSFLGTRSSSDSVLVSERRSSVGRDGVAPASETEPQVAAAGPVLSKSARRAEPEGCSAAPLDSNVPAQPPVTKPLPSARTQQAEEERSRGSAQSGDSSPPDQGGVSGGSSQSSLAGRVAKLLQSDSPATMASATSSVTDQEQDRAREWIRQMISGERCESLELDEEDRRRIEEIKRELLLKKPMKSQGSTDTESSAASSLKAPMSQDQCQPAEKFTTLRDVNNLTEHGPSSDLLDPSPPPPNALGPHLEAQVREIAAREGVTLPKAKARAITSITIATRRRSTSPSPPTSPAPPLSPASEPLHLARLSTGVDDRPQGNGELPPAQDQDEEPGLVLEPSLYNRNQHFKSGYQQRQNTVGGAQPWRGLDGEELNVQKGFGAEESTASESTAHVSHLHLTLSPKPAGHSVNTGAEVKRLQRKEPDLSSPDEGVGLSSPPEWLDSRGGTSNLFKTTVPREGSVSTSTQSFRHQHPTNSESSVPVLLPYKPRGSEELFYVPQTEAAVFSTDAADTTMESSHTGSDDAVPPRFSSEVLGHQDPGLDRGVGIRHTEGIYSKRLRMKQGEQTADEYSQTDVGQTPAAPPQVPVAPLSSQRGGSKRDQGTSPVHFLSYEPRDLQPVGVDHVRARHKNQSSVPEAGREQDPDAPQQASGNLDQLWQRFCDRWTLEEARPTGDREASLLERLERLSRLIHRTRAGGGSEQPQEESAPHSIKPGDKGERRRYDARETERSRRAEDADAWLQVEHGRASDASSFSHSSLQSRHLCPADKDETETLSTASMSTIDTARLIRAFGAHRVQHLKTSPSLGKLYSTITRQRDGREQRRGRSRGAAVLPAETTATDESLAADSTGSSSLPSPRGLSRSVAAKKSVRLVSRGIQAGHLEIVSNGTRRHTRDVGTTFPSPRETRAVRSSSSSLSSVERGRGKRSSSKRCPPGVSWFICADNLRSDTKKENQPESTWRPSVAWLEPYSRREPLRQRQVHEDQQPTVIRDIDPEPRTKPASSGLARVSLQEALEMRRPEFISRSRQRMRRLALQVEERKLQSDFLRDRDEYLKPTAGLRRLPQAAGPGLLRRAVPRKEMIQRSKQIYENLPEMQRKREEERRRTEYRSYRLNAQLYNKRITNRVLGRSAWQ